MKNKQVWCISPSVAAGDDALPRYPWRGVVTEDGDVCPLHNCPDVPEMHGRPYTGDDDRSLLCPSQVFDCFDAAFDAYSGRVKAYWAEKDREKARTMKNTDLRPVTLGRLMWRIDWDKRGHWITGKHGHVHHMWLWVGPTRNQDGITVYNIVIGPLGFAFGLDGKARPSQGGAGF